MEFFQGSWYQKKILLAKLIHCATRPIFDQWCRPHLHPRIPHFVVCSRSGLRLLKTKAQSWIHSGDLLIQHYLSSDNVAEPLQSNNVKLVSQLLAGREDVSFGR
jgi:hypothetical protein